MPLRTAATIVTGVEVDKIHYLPGETVHAIIHLKNGPAATKYQLTGDLIHENDDTRRVFSQDVAVRPQSERRCPL